MRMKKILSALILSALFLINPAVAQTPDTSPKVSVRIMPEFDAVKPGQTLTLAIEQTIKDHWHTYWKNPGDSGEATRINWVLPQGVTASAIQWPVPEAIPFGPLVNFGYNNKAVYLVDITVPADYKETRLPITADLEWLVCSDICIPETDKVELDLPVTTTDSTPSDAAFFADARAKIPQIVAWQGMVEENNNTLLLTFQPDADILPLLSSATKVDFFPEEWGLIQNAGKQNLKIEADKFTLSIPRDTRSLSEVTEIKGIIAYQLADGTRKGFAVQTPLAAMPVANEVIPAAPDATPPENIDDATKTTLPAVQTDATLFQALLFALLGGLILNLMPCVFPILSIKALSLVKLSDGQQHQAVLSGVAYTLGVLACFGLIAGALIGLQHAGQNIGWGFQLQNPVVVLLLAYVLFIVGLNLSGYFEFSSRLASIGQHLTQKKGYTGSFFTGALATIVATPCTAPFMGVALGYALLQPPIVSMAVFLTLGLGLALPYLLLCIIPKLRRSLPKPGLWMETFRQFLSFPMYASAAWLLWVYMQQVEGYYAGLLALLGVVFIALAFWVWQRAPEKNPARLFVRAIAAVFIIISVSIASLSMAKMPVVETMDTEETASVKGEGTIPYSKAKLDQLLTGNDPVFVEMTASWCITCKVNERIALATDATREVFKNEKVTYVQGDWTNQNPEITNFLKQYGRNGVPIYVFYGKRDAATGERPEAVVLPQLLTSGLVAEIVTNQ